MRTFETGATRDSDEGKPDYTKSLSPLALQRFGAYMLKHNVQADGQTRTLDNWKRGIPHEAYVASLGRHVMDLWLHVDGHASLAREPDVNEILCAILFNVQGLLHERLKEQHRGSAATVVRGPDPASSQSAPSMPEHRHAGLPPSQSSRPG